MWGQIKDWLHPKPDPTLDADWADACFWRVDMHSHLLPGVDDGVTTDEQAVQCLQQFVGWGIQCVITTPHVGRDMFPDNTSASLRAGVDRLRTLAAEHRLPLRIEIAAEYMLDDFFLAMVAEGDLLTFGAERYVLIATGFVMAPLYLDTVLFTLQSAGYQPVLAHPERYSYYWHDEPALTRLRERGCLFQLNWMSMVGQYGQQARAQAQRMLENEWVDFIGSDLHRPVSLDRMMKLFGSAEYELLKKQPLRNASLLGPNELSVNRPNAAL